MSLIIVGLIAGVLGGLLGIGGSIIMIPVLTLIFRHDQHLSQAAAMIVNIFVSAPAMLRHQRAGAIRWRIGIRMLPAGLIFIVVGVEVSNHLDGRILERLFGIFLIYVIYSNVEKLIGGRIVPDDHPSRGTWPRASGVGTIMGFAAGLLGIGGGVIAVPLLQRLCHLPLRQCIALSATAMCITVPVGAILKNIELPNVVDVADPIVTSLTIAACFAPTAIIGSIIGAGLTHSLPLRWVRIALVVLLCVACVKFLGIPAQLGIRL
jgi:uncharacterized membrane protein YfcA